MNSLSQSLTLLSDQMVRFDATTSAVYESVSSLLQNLKAIPDTFEGVEKIHSDAYDIINGTNDIQSMVNTTWAKITILIKTIKDVVEEDVSYLEKQYAVEIADICADIPRINEKVDGISVQSNILGHNALELLQCVLRKAQGE